MVSPSSTAGTADGFGATVVDPSQAIDLPGARYTTSTGTTKPSLLGRDSLCSWPHESNPPATPPLPRCQNSLELKEAIQSNGGIESGQLHCIICHTVYPIVRFVPRFVPEANYAASFGLEWNIHARTQYDKTSGTAASETRFFEETDWSRTLEGQILIEAGSGAGRFTEHALGTGATVLSLDYSEAVDANYASNGHHGNLLLVQGDLFTMPFPAITPTSCSASGFYSTHRILKPHCEASQAMSAPAEN